MARGVGCNGNRRMPSPGIPSMLESVAVLIAGIRIVVGR
jgi:hypothetical protein